MYSAAGDCFYKIFLKFFGPAKKTQHTILYKTKKIDLAVCAAQTYKKEITSACPVCPIIIVNLYDDHKV